MKPVTTFKEEKEEFFDAMEKNIFNIEGGISDLDSVNSEEEDEFFDAVSNQDWLIKQIAAFNIPPSIFNYKNYNFNSFTSWYNISSEIFKEINRVCQEKKVLNLALSLLMLPYIIFIAIGLIIYNSLKANSNKIQEVVKKDKKRKSETIIPKRLIYCALVTIVVFIDAVMLIALIVPATIALVTFYLLNRELVHSLITAFEISTWKYSNNQNIEVFFYEVEITGSNIEYDIEIKFPSQFKQLLKDLYKNTDNKWFSVIQDSKDNIILKLSTNINLKNCLKPLHNEIKNVLITLIQEFTKTMEELIKLEKKDITYNKFKELLGEFKLKVGSSIDSKLTTYLIENAYQVAFIQAIKFQRDRRRKDFSLEDAIENTLIKQQLESEGDGLQTEKERIIKDLKNVKVKVPNALDDNEFPVFKAEWERLKEEGKIFEKTMKDSIKEKKAKNNAQKEIEVLKKQSQVRYAMIYKKLKSIYDERKDNLTNDNLRRKLEGLFKLEYDNQQIEQKLAELVIRKANIQLDQLGARDNEEKNLKENLKQLKNSEKKDSVQIDNFVKKMYLKITKYKINNLIINQAKSIKNSHELLKTETPYLIKRINAYQEKIKEYLEQQASSLLKNVIEGNKDFNKYLKNERNKRGKKHPNTKLIERHLQNNQEILEVLKQLELEKEGLLMNTKTKNNYREELESREKIKFAIIEDELLKIFEEDTFNEIKIKKLLEKAELEFFLAEECMKYPVVQIKDNIKYFCKDLLSPLISRLAENIVNNLSKNSWKIQPVKAIQIGLGCIKTGLAVACGNKSTEGKVSSVVHDTHKAIRTFLQHFQSSYEEVGTFLGNLFFDDGETFKSDVWPQVEEHLHGMWNRFFKDIEFKIGNKLDEVNLTQATSGNYVFIT